LLYPLRWDLPILRSLGRKVIVQFWGSDVRGKRPEDLGYLRYADAVVVGSYHMLDYVPDGAHVVLPGLDLAQWPRPALQQARVGTPRIVHAPSRRETKGTAHVLDALESLRDRGVPFEVQLVEGIPHGQAVDIYASCDIAIDQLAAGWYGVFALETMALGKAVLGYISPPNADRLERARGLRPPLVGVTSDTLADELEVLLRDPERRLLLGRLGREFVEQLHDIDRSAGEVIQLYQQVQRAT
jgi:glycosyltransferase involved in cell wall biosynthesis